MSNKGISPQVRASNFMQSTRQYKQELPSMSFSEGQTVSVSFPKTRFLSKVSLRLKGSFKTSHASKTSFTKAKFDMYKLIRQLRMSINNGFNPFQIGGAELYLYNVMNKYSAPTADPLKTEFMGNTVSVAGTSNEVCFTLDLPVTLNDRDPIGLLLLQNEQTVVTLNVDCGYIKDIMTDSDVNVSDINIKLIPVLETFSVPMLPEAIPDYSIIKLVNEQIENVVGAGDMIVKLPVGLTYRRVLIYIAQDANFTPINHANLGNFQLVFNQADTPYNVSADHIAYENRKAYAGQLPAGCYALDFSSQGIAGLGGGRDYIDTERLTEFWLRINFANINGASNYVYVISEKMAKLL